MTPHRRIIAILAAALWLGPPPTAGRAAEREDPTTTRPALAGFGNQRRPSPPWELSLLPNQKLPQTEFFIEEVEGRTALVVRAVSSFGDLTHRFQPPGEAGHLSWTWKVGRFADGADLRHKRGDDNAIKVCALFDLPLEQLSFWDRFLLKRARGRAKRDLPSAAVCYAWDPNIRVGTHLNNPFSRRLRYIVLRSGAIEPGRWFDESRDLRRDFLDLFGKESRGTVPPLLGISLGGDSDNTRGESLAWIADLRHGPPQQP